MIFHRLTAVILSLGMLGAAACSACSPSTTNNNSSSTMEQPSYTCGAGTHQVGMQCVGNSTTATGAPKAAPIKTGGNN